MKAITVTAPLAIARCGEDRQLNPFDRFRRLLKRYDPSEARDEGGRWIGHTQFERVYFKDEDSGKVRHVDLIDIAEKGKHFILGTEIDREGDPVSHDDKDATTGKPVTVVHKRMIDRALVVRRVPMEVQNHTKYGETRKVKRKTP
jgi:hypothetical protein